jgi:hypothetical protein
MRVAAADFFDSRPARRQRLCTGAGASDRDVRGVCGLRHVRKRRAVALDLRPRERRDANNLRDVDPIVAIATSRSSR